MFENKIAQKLLNMLEQHIDNNPDMDIEEISKCTNIYCKLQKSKIEEARNFNDIQKLKTYEKDVDENVGEYVQRIDTVYDIPFVQNVLINAMKRFKDDLHLIGDFSISNVKTIGKSKQIFNEFLAQENPDKKTHNKCMESLWSDEQLADDSKNLKVFQTILQNVEEQCNKINNQVKT